MVQCKCKTDDGSRCKRAADPSSNYGFCWQHANSSHSKMRCVSLARKNIGYASPKHRPSPRHGKKKSPSKNKK